MAATETISKVEKVESKLAVKKRISSREYRSEKTFSVTAGFGIALSEMAQSLNGEYFVDGESLVSLRLSYYDEDRRSSYVNEEKQFSAELGFKRFVSNSFFLKPMVYYRNYKKTRTYDSFWYSDENNGVERYVDAGMGFSIGNQWQFSTLTIGCDWFGISSSVKTFTDTTDFDFREYSFNLLNFFVGMSF